jgi:hypothetical protein
MREIGLRQAAGDVDLLENDLLLRAVEGAPRCDMALKGAELARGVAVGMALKQQREERFGLERRVALQMLLDPGSVGDEGVGTGAIVTGMAKRTREFGATQVLAGGGDAHVGTSGGLFKGFAMLPQNVCANPSSLAKKRRSVLQPSRT